MLLHSVKLQGFLAHHGREVDGETKPLELDFRESGLWLMHGANGSGKSSVFDAITFALWDEARGSKRLQLVNDKCDIAHVEVEFGIGDQQFLVKRRITLNGARDSHRSWSEVSRWNAAKNNWQIEAGVGNSIGGVKTWANQTLQISYDNFASAVILKQGEADRFLAAPPAERKDRLMELLDLDVYKKLSGAANAQRTSWAGIRATKEQRLADCREVGKAELEAARLAASEAKTRATEAASRLEFAKTALADAETAASLQAQIAAKERLQAADAAILADETAIETAAAELETLTAILPSLRALSSARSGVARAQSEADRATRAAHDARAQLEALQAPLSSNRDHQRDAQAALGNARQALSDAEARHQTAQDELKMLLQIEALEAKIEQTESELEPHRAVLADAATIEARRERIARLMDAGRLVKAVANARAKLDNAERERKQREQARDELAASAQTAQQNATRAQQLADEIGAHVEAAREAKREVESELSVRRGILKTRRSLGDAVECPTCGTHLTNDEICRRLRQDEAQLADEIERLEARQKQREGELESALDEQKRRHTEAKTVAHRASELRAQLAGARSAHESAHKVGADCRDEWQTRRVEAAEFADTDLETLKNEALELGKETIEAEWNALQAARAVEIRCQTRLENYREQLQNLPDWDENKRASVRDLVEPIAETWARAGRECAAAEAAFSRAETALEGALENERAAHNAGVRAADECARRVADSRDASAALAHQTAQLPQVWRAHEAAQTDAALKQLERHATDLQPQAARRAELNAARERRASLSGAIETLRAQLADVPAAHRVAVAVAQNAFDEARTLLAELSARVATLAEALDELVRARDHYERCRRERDEAEIEAAHYAELARAFGRDGLQAKIVRGAQDDLKRLSNGILGRLSNGQWQLDLRGENDSELEIVARDEARGGIERTFDCLSGGERFRVAISLAIAVGQMARGGAPMHTLVIDEGFGALDEENRALMVENLRHLSQHELCGGRIIVVSHQEDVCETFGHRYRLSRRADGYANVELRVG